MSLPETTSYSRSALFSGATVPVVARFSLGGGDPNAPDAGKGPRGMGLEFRLADYFRDDYADWGAKAEPMAVKLEAKARDCRLRGDDVGAVQFEIEANQWRQLIRCR